MSLCNVRLSIVRAITDGGLNPSLSIKDIESGQYVSDARRSRQSENRDRVVRFPRMSHIWTLAFVCRGQKYTRWKEGISAA